MRMACRGPSLFTRAIAIAFLAASQVLCAATVFAATEAEFLRVQNQFLAEEAAGHFQQAEALARKLLTLSTQVYGNLPRREATGHYNIGVACYYQGKYPQAESEFKTALPLFLKGLLGKNDAQYAACMNMLGNTYLSQARYVEADKYLRDALATRETLFGPQHPDVAESHTNLGNLNLALGKYADAEDDFKQGVEIMEAVGEKPAVLADCLNNLAMLYNAESRFTESEALQRRGLEIRRKVLQPLHPRIADSLQNLANVQESLGRFTDAELLLRECLPIREKTQGREHPALADSLNNLGNVLKREGRYSDAELLYQRALAIYESKLGNRSPSVAMVLDNLSGLYLRSDSLEKAEPPAKRGYEIRAAVFGPTHPEVAKSLESMAMIAARRGRLHDAVEFDRQALAIRERSQGPTHHDCFFANNNLAVDYRDLGKPDEAMPYIDRAVEIAKSGRVGPDLAFAAYDIRARLAWDAGRRDDALSDLKSALEQAEDQRRLASGTDLDRARLFESFSAAFARMVGWQIERNDVAQAFLEAERGRSRSLIDQMQVAGIDLLAGVPAKDARKLRRREAQSAMKVSSLEKQLGLLALDRVLPASARQQRQKDLEAQLATARADLVNVFRDVRNTSPAYRLAVNKDYHPIGLDQLAKWAEERQAIVLQYIVSATGTWVIFLGKDLPATGVALAIDAQQAAELKVSAGPLNAGILRAVIAGGLAPEKLLARTDGPSQSIGLLSALWPVLIPEPARKAILSGNYELLVVVPDGPLSNLPFDALVVKSAKEPLYLLDAGPPILYPPSSTVLVNLANRLGSKRDAGSVLTIGDPSYGGTEGIGPERTAGRGTPLLTVRSRYQRLGGGLQPLPYSGRESRSVAGTFRDQGIEVTALTRATATEAELRKQVGGRRLLHFACHGLTDDSFGNLFGALALSPGRNAEDPADDGFLTLAEIYELNLNGCEMAILSACNTNVGPQQEGEGVWALSRGFLAAGSRRVIASNWLVNDEAAATLVSTLCSRIAKSEKTGKVGYARALHAAKLAVRQEDRWSNPFFWSSFVLVGPD